MKGISLPRSIFPVTYLGIFLLLALGYATNLLAQEPAKRRERAYGLSLATTTHGNALGGFYLVGLSRKWQALFEGRIIDVKGDTEFPVVDQWTGYVYKTGERNLLLVPLLGEVKYHPFVDQIAGNFSPHVVLGLGPTIVLDTAEEVAFLERWKKVDVGLVIGAFVGVAVDIFLPSMSYMSVGVGYVVFPMGREVDGRTDYNGTVLQFMFGRRRPF